MLRASSEHIPPYGQSDQTLEKYCKRCKQVSRTANPGPNRIETVAQIRTHGYNTLSALGKPFGLTEFGPDKLSNWDENPRNDYDYEAFIQGVVRHLPLCTSFCIWHQYYGLQFQQKAQQCLDHPWTVNRRDMPSFGRQAGTSSTSAGEARGQ